MKYLPDPDHNNIHLHIKKTLRKHYGITDPEIHKLEGTDTLNYKVLHNGKSYILKLDSPGKTDREFVFAESAMVNFLHHKDHSAFPKVEKNNQGQFAGHVDFGNGEKTVRLISWLDGTTLTGSPHHFPLCISTGEFLARMDLMLKDFHNNTIKARRYHWDLQYFQDQKNHLVYLNDPATLSLARYFFLQHSLFVSPVASGLRRSIIHGDANDHNLLVRESKISGIIDFGDACESHLINELAIALAYLLMEKDDPVQWAIPVISAYHKILPLEEKEVDILYWLTGARLTTTLCHAARESHLHPENPYVLIHEKRARNLLYKWIRISPLFAAATFRKACGFKVPQSKPYDQIITGRMKYIPGSFSVSYQKPLYIDRAAFQYVYDKYGNTLLDAYNNIPHVGHCHPVVVETGQQQMALLNTNTRYLYDQLNDYSDQLIRHFPPSLNKVFLVNSGSAATDLALRLARNFTQKKYIAALEYGYHGNTHAGIEISHYKFSGRGGAGTPPFTIPLPIPDTYRGQYGAYHKQAGLFYAKDAVIQMYRYEGAIAAFIAEPIVGCAGQVPLAKGYLTEIYRWIRSQGGVCISDEVQTGFGRLGEVFWGFEQHDVIPDMVVLGKPMANGHPMGAVVCTEEIAQAFDNGMEFFSSFGGNPVSCAMGSAVLNVISDEQLQLNAKITGSYYLQQLSKLQQHCEAIGDVRGSGLFIGIDLVKNRITREPDTQLAQLVKNMLREQFVMVSTDGPADNVIKSKPPLCFSRENVDEVIFKFERIMNANKGYHCRTNHKAK